VTTIEEIEAHLLAPGAFVTAATIEGHVPNRPGLYAIRVLDKSALPEPFRTHARSADQDLIYIGLTTRSLNERLVRNELRAKGHGTFFRSLGAVLGYRPLPGSLPHGKLNYTFSEDDRDSIVGWINNNLEVSFFAHEGDQRAVEDVLVRRHRPLLNLDKNPEALPELRALRAQCVETARSPLSPTHVLEELDHSGVSRTLLEQALHLDIASRRELIRALEDSLEQPFASGPAR
jgi:hypothetical protein